MKGVGVWYYCGMPSKHIQKTYVEDSYYHIYNRGVEKRVIFIDNEDYTVFLSMLKRHLSKKHQWDKQGREYPNYHEGITLLAFCLMPNHFHLLVYQKEDRFVITKLMRSVCTAYTMYFNRKYKRVGHLFQERFKASLIQEDVYLQHISRYIHLNPDNYQQWQYSSLQYYLGEKSSSWLDPNPILSLFKGENYLRFMEDYRDHRQMLKDLKSQLADN
ncbi:MAG TPA: transposase [Candidatus Saccharimonadales bacterium]|nr:transposase [Candidatus Saccharimonadales bacterium]